MTITWFDCPCGVTVDAEHAKEHQDTHPGQYEGGVGNFTRVVCYICGNTLVFLHRCLDCNRIVCDEHMWGHRC